MNFTKIKIVRTVTTTKWNLYKISLRAKKGQVFSNLFAYFIKRGLPRETHRDSMQTRINTNVGGHSRGYARHSVFHRLFSTEENRKSRLFSLVRMLAERRCSKPVTNTPLFVFVVNTECRMLATENNHARTTSLRFQTASSSAALPTPPKNAFPTWTFEIFHRPPPPIFPRRCFVNSRDIIKFRSIPVRACLDQTKWRICRASFRRSARHVK